MVSGVSGSGKSSLAFDTIYAEGQRRYVESLSAYARQFLERIEKPDVDEIDGLAPAIAIKQKNTTRNPRSTVATATEIYDYLRLLYARCRRGALHLLRRPGEARLHGRSCGGRLALGEGTRLNALFPVRHEMPAAEAGEASETRFETAAKASAKTGGESGGGSGADERGLKARLMELRAVGIQPALSERTDLRVLDAGIAAGYRLHGSAVCPFGQDSRQRRQSRAHRGRGRDCVSRSRRGDLRRSSA